MCKNLILKILPSERGDPDRERGEKQNITDLI